MKFSSRFLRQAAGNKTAAAKILMTKAAYDL